LDNHPLVQDTWLEAGYWETFVTRFRSYVHWPINKVLLIDKQTLLIDKQTLLIDKQVTGINAIGYYT
jgi:hypothetical protein